MTLKIAFIGGGEKTLALMRLLEKVPETEIVIVTDDFRDAPALRYGAENQIRISSNHSDALKYPDLDILFELSGRESDLLGMIRENLPRKTALFTQAQSDLVYTIVSSVIEKEFSTVEDCFMSNIKDIKKSIADFATITKNIDILAINASIEAARAGEAGKGFAVVATSIKDLVKGSRDTLQYVRATLEKLTLIHKDMQETHSRLHGAEKDTANG